MPRALRPILVLAPLALLQACAHRAAPPDLTNPADAAAANAALLPVRLTIHPLTRIGVDPKGQPALLMHLELRDRFDQNTRALGAVRIEIQAPSHTAVSAASDGSRSSESLAWNIDLRDPDQNALLFDDLITRTYALTLTGLPRWLTESPNAAGATVAAAFTFPDPESPAGPPRTLTDTARLTR